jgi:hypothetical protein
LKSREQHVDLRPRHQGGTVIDGLRTPHDKADELLRHGTE